MITSREANLKMPDPKDPANLTSPPTGGPGKPPGAPGQRVPSPPGSPPEPGVFTPSDQGRLEPPEGRVDRKPFVPSGPRAMAGRPPLPDDERVLPTPPPPSPKPPPEEEAEVPPEPSVKPFAVSAEGPGEERPPIEAEEKEEEKPILRSRISGFAPTAPKPPEEEEPSVVSATPPPTTYVFTGGGLGGGLKKIITFLILILVIVGASFGVYKFVLPKIGGLRLPSVVPTQEATITYWGLWEPKTVFQQVIADFEKDNPKIKINYVQQSHKDYRERLASSFAKGDAPDIFRFHNSWVPMLKKDLDAVPADVYNAASFEATFYPVARESLRQGTNYVGIPLQYDGLALFINEEIFGAAGKTPPVTWDELRKVALELTTYDSEGNIQIAGVALGRTENIDHWSDILAVMMLQNGADLENPTGKLAEDALDYYVLFSKTDKVWNERLPSSTVAFANGKLAMYFGPSWRALNIKEINPALKFKIIPIPQLPETNITWASFWAEGVWEKSKNKKAAWEFLKYLSSKETLQRLYQAQAGTRLFGEPYPRVDMAALLETDKYLGAYITQAPAARSWYLCSRTFDNGINDKIIKYFEDVVNSVNKGEGSKEALTKAAQGVAQVLAQYGLSTGVVR